MVTIVKAFCTLVWLAMLIEANLVMDGTLKEQILLAHRRWFPGSLSVHYQRATHNRFLLQKLRESVNRMQIIEVNPSLTHRHFFVPLKMRGGHQLFGLQYGATKNHFAAFRMPWAANVATFEGIGAINGINKADHTAKLADSVHSSTAREFGIFFQVPH